MRWSPTFWLVYTYSVSGYALDFANGPYSAKAIALRSTGHGAYTYPGQHHVFTAALYFLKSAKLNMGAASWGQILFIAAVAGTAVAALALSSLWGSAAALAADAVLRAFDSLRKRPYLCAGLVSAFVLQRALRS